MKQILDLQERKNIHCEGSSVLSAAPIRCCSLCLITCFLRATGNNAIIIMKSKEKDEMSIARIAKHCHSLADMSLA